MGRRLGWFAALSVLVAIAFIGAYRPSSGASSKQAANPPLIEQGRRLFLRDCAVCHGPRGEGSERGPNLSAAGTAAVDFMIRTGRMPLSSPRAPLQRHRTRYDDAEISAINAYAATFITHGPAIPTVATHGINLQRGNETYRAECAACHQAAGAGGALAFGVNAPALNQATPLEVVEAMRIGPGRMPKFDPATIDDHEASEVAAYVRYLHHPTDSGGLNLGHLGPVPEGLVAWLLGLGGLLVIARLLGQRVKRSEH